MYSVDIIKFCFVLSRITDAKDIKKTLQIFNHTLVSNPKQQSGQFKWSVPLNGVDYLTRTFVFDSHDCSSTGYPYNALAKGMLDISTIS